jgi:hypothetical protein
MYGSSWSVNSVQPRETGWSDAAGVTTAAGKILAIDLMMVAARREVAPHPMQQRMFAVGGDVFRPETGRVVQADDAATAGRHRGELLHDPFRLRHPHRRKRVADEDDRDDFLPIACDPAATR